MIPLQPPALFNDHIPWQEDLLSPAQLERKHQAIQAHRTQYGSSPRYLLSFIRPNELFGDFPLISLQPSAPPVSLSSRATVPAAEPHEELTDQERAKFVGFEERRVWLEARHLVVAITYSRPLAEDRKSVV